MAWWKERMAWRVVMFTNVTLVAQVTKVRRMVADLEEREDSVVRKGFLPLIHDVDHRNLRKRELQHKVKCKNTVSSPDDMILRYIRTYLVKICDVHSGGMTYDVYPLVECICH